MRPDVAVRSSFVLRLSRLGKKLETKRRACLLDCYILETQKVNVFALLFHPYNFAYA